MLWIGIAGIVAALVMALHGAHVARMRPFLRPRFTLWPAYGALWGTAWRSVLAVSLLAMAATSPRVALGATLALGIVALRIAWARSSRALARGIEREVGRRVAAQPDRSREAHLRELVRERHPEWAPDFVDQLLAERAATGDVARVLVRMERIWRQ